MRLIEQKKLFYREGTSDKVYEVDLCEAGEGEFVVNFRYGKRGTRLREGTKTTFPLSLEKARQVFDKLVNSKLHKGYLEGGAAAEPSKAAATPALQPNENAPTLGSEAQRTKLLEHIRRSAIGDAARTWKRSRVVWRAGELKLPEAVAPMLVIARESTDPLTRYSLAWSFGKLQAVEAVDVLQGWRTDPAIPANVQRMSCEALLAILDDENKRKLLEEFRAQLPRVLRDAIDAHQHDQLEKLVENGQLSEFLPALYSIANLDGGIREVVYRALTTLPLKPPHFRSLRAIFKAAEFRLDAEVFGLIAYRLEKTRHYYQKNGWNRGTYINGEFVLPKKEMQLPNPRLAYSKNTRRYLRDRIVRNFRRAGELGDAESYITLATGVLLAFDDAVDKGITSVRHEYHYDRASRNLRNVEHYLSDFAQYQAFNFLLYQNSSRYVRGTGGSWEYTQGCRPDDPLPAEREEAFPQLWDAAPDALAHLLTHSRCERVHQFAAKVWRKNLKVFAETANAAFVIALLGQPYTTTAALGLELAKQRFDPAAPDVGLLSAVLCAGIEEARRQGIEWINDSRNNLLKDVSFVAGLLLNPYDDVRKFTAESLTPVHFSEADIRLLVPKVVAGLLAMHPGNDATDATAHHVRQILAVIGRGQLNEVSLPVIEDLLRHGAHEVKALGAYLALQKDPSELPEGLLEALIVSPAQSVREIGMDLFAKLSDDALTERRELLANLCVCELADVRKNAIPIVERLAARERKFAEEMVAQIYPLLLRKERYEGLHADILRLFESSLSKHLHVIPPEHAFRMADSQYAPAQALALLLLQQFVNLSETPMDAIARLASCPLLAMREHIRAFFQERPEKVKAEAADALRILDSDWDDTRDWGFTFFREVFTESDWSPELLVSICDSVRGAVQDFGREMITRHFRSADGDAYLLQLSQHPASELQTFASNYLERFASGDLDKLRRLESYFITVLSTVNRGRVAKARVVQFLSKEARASLETAEFVLHILNRQSVSVAIQNKAACIKAMRDIHVRWPAIDPSKTVARMVAFPVYTPD